MNALRKQRTYAVYSASLVVGLLCFHTACHAACNQERRTRGEYTLSFGGMSPYRSSLFQQTTAGLAGIGLSFYITPRIAVDGDFFYSNQNTVNFDSVWPVAGQVVVLPFRDASSTGCIVPYFGAGAAGDMFGSFQGPSVGGGAKYYWGGAGIGVDARAVFPQVDAKAPRGLGTLYMVTVRLSFQPRKQTPHKHE